MNKLLTLLCLLLCAALPAQQAIDYNTFLKRFTDLTKIKDDRGLDRLIRDTPVQALEHLEVLVRERFRRTDDPALKESVTALKASFERAFESQVMTLHEQYLTNASPSTYEALDKSKALLNQLYELKNQAIAKRERSQFLELGRNATDLARRFEQLGHQLKAAETWAVACEIWNAIPEPTPDTERDAIFAMEQYSERRQATKYTQDPEYLRNMNWLKSQKETVAEAAKERERRKAAGYDDDARGPDALVLPDAKEEIVPLEFKALTAPQEDLFVRGGPVPTFWLSATVFDSGPSALSNFKRKDMFLVWEGGNKYGITDNGNEADLKKIKFEPIQAGSGRSLKPSVFHLDADKTQSYAMWFYLPGESEPMMGLSHNLAPREKSADVAQRSVSLYFRSASSWVAEIGGETVTFYDDNSDGLLFQEDPLAQNIWDRGLGVPDGNGVQVPSYDSMRIGRGPLQPYSSFVQIDGKWYHLRAHEGGQKVGARPLNPEFFKTGQVAFKWNGLPAAKPQFLILKGRGAFSAAHYNVVTPKPIDVPVGDYEIAFGRIVEGRGGNLATASIFKGDSELVKVEAGKVTTLTLGAPFTLDFVRGGTDPEVEIDSTRFRVKGARGELYARLNNAPAAPEVLVARAADGKGARPIGEFIPILDSELLNSAAKKLRGAGIDLGLEAALFPMVKGDREGGMVWKGKLPAPGMVVGLAQKKHRLFGKLDPVWR